MGSMVTRYVRDLNDVGGFETVSGSSPCSRDSSPPGTPIGNTNTCFSEFDPRSPSAEIVRTPIEVSSNFNFHARKSYLETDLDTLSTNEYPSKPEDMEDPNQQEDLTLPPGLTSAHLLKLQFLGIDPRSPSSDVIRTPIQVGKEVKRDPPPFHFDDSLSVGSLSSQDIFCTSNCSSDFTRDCSDPSAFVSENEDTCEREEELSLSCSEQVLSGKVDEEATDGHHSSPPKGSSVHIGDETPKSSNGLKVYQESSIKTSELASKESPITPEGIRKPSGSHPRTPLTPIGNCNRTPNSILRAKQSHTIEKEIRAKARIYSTEDNVKITPKLTSLSSNQKENSFVAGRQIHKDGFNTDKNSGLSASKKRALAQWDQDSSVII